MVTKMTMIYLVLTVFGFCVVSSLPIVLRESTPNGESIIAISSSDPEVEKYLLNYASQRGNRQNPLLRSSFYSPEAESLSYSTPEKTVSGTGRSFTENSPLNPFLAQFLLPPNLDGFQFSNWFRNIENIYDHNTDASFGNGGEVRTATAVNDNGQVYGKVETVHSDNKRPQNVK